MVEFEAAKELERHVQFLRENWKPHPDCDVIEALGMAINALEKQTPKLVHEQQWTDTKCDCGYVFSEFYEDGYYDIPYKNKTDYCPKCGQHLYWR